MSRHPLRIAGIIVVAVFATGTVHGQSSTAVAGWDAYLAASERRISAETGTSDRFLAIDFLRDGVSIERRLRAGEIVLTKMESHYAHGDTIEVPGALVHHWMGDVWLKGARLGDILWRLEHTPPERFEADVVASALLAGRPDAGRMFLKVRRTKIITVVYDTEHDVEYRQLSVGRAVSSSHAIKIAELENPFTPAEREVAAGKDRGFLWRWNSYWRYEQIDGGVIVECESISLSRSVPAMLRYLAGPMIESTARESMERTLTAIRDRLPK